MSANALANNTNTNPTYPIDRESFVLAIERYPNTPTPMILMIQRIATVFW
jgi:hypothetical protein